MPADDVAGWIRAFFEGSWLVPGWNARRDRLLAGRPAQEREALRERLDRLGRRIAPEWARDNAVRRIDNRDLEAWGARLAAAQGERTPHLEQVLAQIEAEVDARLG